ncbi:biotin synthase BioB [Clostridium sp. chh4-2]|uniref:biotin synthase BioB n=1 Tax=Clostridium sp. chh4-2 TaxID=2067550 RepID=UPI000CCF8157|nr:biotin synthase BioB [Clostridium sp. chh4-2]PNV59955.1 biotin synthase BioB [Clostridium sp. chh4-2]
MSIVRELKNKVLSGQLLSREEAVVLAKAPFEELVDAADEIRTHFCGNRFDLCTIVNGKSGQCSEDCKYCAQSAHYDTGRVESYPLLSTEELVEHAKINAGQGVLRYSIVTSGKRLSDQEVEQACESIREIRKQAGIKVCISFGLLSQQQFQKLREAGADRVHCNLESSRRYFPEICTTHTFEEKVETLKAAKRAGMEICSGGIMGLGETMEDRIDMVLSARELGVKSVPVNLLNPIPGTPLGHNPIMSDEEVLRIIAVFRFLIPDASIRLAGGRGLLEDKGERCFRSGANAAISGDMLTTAGITVKTDLELLEKLGYEVKLGDE